MENPREIVCFYITGKESRLEKAGWIWDHSIKNNFTRQSCFGKATAGAKTITVV